MSEQAIRILFVDDEQSILLTLPEILRQHGYEVTGVGTVNDALAKIASARYDVLISDLNIGQAGDGFTVVSAMRRTQPSCITLIMTGYPGFDSALEAIRSQVDDYLIKPTPVPTLIHLIEQKLHNPRTGMATAATKRIYHVLRENKFEITQRSLDAMKSDPALRAVPIADEDRIETIPRTLEDLASMLESNQFDHPSADAIERAKMRGAKRYKQGYSVPLLAAHVRLVEQAIFEVVHEHMRSLNLSYLMFDLKRLHATMGIQLEHTLQAYLNVEERIGHHVGKS